MRPELRQLLSRYGISDIDDASNPRYYGFLDALGGWFILKNDTTAGAKSYRYASGGTDYAANWTGRAGLSYDYMSAVF